MPKQKAPSITWISSDYPREPYVTIDNQKRLYISRPTRDLMSLPPGHFRLITGYDLVNKRIVLAKPEVVRVPDIKPFKFDKRSYTNAKPFVEQANLEGALPKRFIYSGRDYSAYPDGSYVFTMEGFESPDERGRGYK